MRLFPALILCAGAWAGSISDQKIDELAQRIRALAANEVPWCRTDTLARAAALLTPARPELAAGMWPLTPAAVPRQPPAPDTRLAELRRQLTIALDQGAAVDAVRPLAGAFLEAIEHGGDDPADYALLARVVNRYQLSTGGDNASVRARLALVELAALVSTQYDFTLPAVDGRTLALQEQRGKVVLLSFWATWCPPCRAEMPAFEKLFREAADRGFTVLAVTDEPPGIVREFVAKHGYTFPVLLDTERKVFEHYHVNGLPATKILDGTGRMRAEINEAGETDLRSLLKIAGLAID